MNTNIILDGFNAMLKQLIASAVADAVKPLQDRITALEINQTLVSPAKVDFTEAILSAMQDRITALEINQTLVSSAKGDFSEAMRNLLIGYDFINRSDVVVLVEEAIGNHDFSDIDISGAIEEGIENYDFSNIIEENMPDPMSEGVVQDMINESLDNLTITRN